MRTRYNASVNENDAGSRQAIAMKLVWVVVLLATAALAAGLLRADRLANLASAESPGSIAGFVFYDLNENGLRDRCESGLERSYLTLAKVTGSEVSEPVEVAATAWDGSYSFSDVEPGDYLVVLGPVPPVGGPQGAPPLPAADAALMHRLTVEAGESIKEVNFRIALPEAAAAPPSPVGASIQGYVFFDADGDGVPDEGECRLKGWSLTLLGEDMWSETGVDGGYSFGGLSAGAYRVRLSLVQTPEGIWQATFPVPDPRTGVQHEVVLENGQAASDVSFGVRRLEGTGAIGGFVFEDVNRNGVMEPDEPRLERAQLRLEGVDFSTYSLEPAATEADGSYLLKDLPAGRYRVFASAPMLGLSIQTTGPEGPIALAEGERAEVDFGFAQLRPASISGRVINDLNGDGVLEEDEPGLGGWSLCLARGSSDVIDCGIIHTEEDGTYAVGDLGPGSHGLRLDHPELKSERDQPPYWVVTVPDAYWRTVILEEGQAASGVDFGVHRVESPSPEPSSSGSSSGPLIEWWQIALAAVCSVMVVAGGILAAVGTVRRS